MRERAVTLLLGLVLALSAAASDPPQERVDALKAAFLYRFAAFIEWPASAFPDAESPIVIGVVGADPVAAELARALPGRKAASRPIRMVQVERGAQAGNCCHIVFVGAASGRTDEILAQAQGHAVLTVTDVGSSHPKGSVINFLLLEDRLRFDISREAAERNGLTLRSQLLAVARQVSAQ